MKYPNDELDQVAATILQRAITDGRLPAQPRPETLTLVADIVRTALSGAGMSDAIQTTNDRRRCALPAVKSGGQANDPHRSD